jgi:hypothetical protein
VGVSCAKTSCGDVSATKIDEKTIRSNAHAMRWRGIRFPLFIGRTISHTSVASMQHMPLWLQPFRSAGTTQGKKAVLLSD